MDWSIHPAPKELTIDENAAKAALAKLDAVTVKDMEPLNTTELCKLREFGASFRRMAKTSLCFTPGR